MQRLILNSDFCSKHLIERFVLVYQRQSKNICYSPLICNSKLVILDSTTPPVSAGSPLAEDPGVFTFFNLTFEKSSVDCNAALASFAKATFLPFKTIKKQIKTYWLNSKILHLYQENISS